MMCIGYTKSCSAHLSWLPSSALSSHFYQSSICPIVYRLIMPSGPTSTQLSAILILKVGNILMVTLFYTSLMWIVARLCHEQRYWELKGNLDCFFFELVEPACRMCIFLFLSYDLHPNITVLKFKPNYCLLF